jgi:hypothetical protein
LIDNYSIGMKLGLSRSAEAVSVSSSSRDGGGIGLPRYGFSYLPASQSPVEAKIA